MCNLNELRAPFAPQDIDWRISRGGISSQGAWAFVLAYATARAIQDRLDAVMGPAKWRNNFASGPQGGVLCGISLFLDGSWVTKWDGAENTQMEAIKGGLSDAMKRASVQWGIGRYLYKMEESLAEILPDDQKGRYRSLIRGNDGKKVMINWNPPPLPAWAMPERLTVPSRESQSLKTGEKNR